MWQQWVNGILGLWVIVAAWIYLPSGAPGRALLMITGLIVAILAFWGGSMASSHSGGSRAQPTA